MSENSTQFIKQMTANSCRLGKPSISAIETFLVDHLNQKKNYLIVGDKDGGYIIGLANGEMYKLTDFHCKPYNKHATKAHAKKIEDKWVDYMSKRSNFAYKLAYRRHQKQTSIIKEKCIAQ